MAAQRPCRVCGDRTDPTPGWQQGQAPAQVCPSNVLSAFVSFLPFVLVIPGKWGQTWRGSSELAQHWRARLGVHVDPNPRM